MNTKMKWILPSLLTLAVGFAAFAMTGWRLGFGIAPEAMAKHMAALMNNTVSCTATFVQKAGEAALAAIALLVPSMMSAVGLPRVA